MTTEIRDQEAFRFGVYASLVFTPIYNFVQRRCH